MTWPYPHCGRRRCGRTLRDGICPEHGGDFLPRAAEWEEVTLTKPVRARRRAGANER